MTKQTMTKEERKAANKALAADIRNLVAAGKADQAYALVTNKGEHWTLLVANAVKAAEAKAEKAAEKAKADKGKGKGSTAKAAKADKGECTDPCTDPECGGYGMPLSAPSDVELLMQQVAALSAALQALQGPAVSTPKAPAKEWIVRDPESDWGGFAMCVGNRVKAILTAGDDDLRSDARTEALQCAKWCDAAALAESDKAERERLTKKAATFRKAAAALKA